MGTSIIRINLGFVNSYLIHSRDGFILVDTGISNSWGQLETELIKHNCLPGNLKLVVLTHGDTDHCGNCAILQEKYGVKTAIHQGDLEMIKTGIMPVRHATTLLGKIINRLGSRMNLQPVGFEPDVLLQNGQTLEEFGFATKIFHTPGHTAGSIVLLTEDGSLIVGDTFVNRTKPKPAELIQNEFALKDSLVLIKGLPVKMVYPGHGNPFNLQDLKIK